MRLLSCRQVIRYVREHGIAQFISLYNANKEHTADDFYWGDEIEYQLVSFDDEQRTVRSARTVRDLSG